MTSSLVELYGRESCGSWFRSIYSSIVLVYICQLAGEIFQAKTTELVDAREPQTRGKKHLVIVNSTGRWGFPGGSVGKNQRVIQEMWVQSMGWEDPLKKEMTTHSSILAWEIP